MDAYFRHVDYLIDRFQPDYTVLAMEVNDLYIASEKKWNEYNILTDDIRNRVKQRYPNLLVSESVTLHNWFNPDVSDPSTYIQKINDYINQRDFAAISFYPFLMGLENKNDFQAVFDFVHDHITIPIAFVETAHIAEWLVIPSLGVLIKGDVCSQQYYLESLLLNAYHHEYEFIIWWAFRDFDEFWKTFPAGYKDIGKIWRDTGLLDEKGLPRPSYKVWTEIYSRG